MINIIQQCKEQSMDTCDDMDNSREKSMLSQRSQTQKATRYMTPGTGNVRKRQIQRQKGEGCHKAGGWETGVTANGVGFPWGMMGMFWN